MVVPAELGDILGATNVEPTKRLIQDAVCCVDRLHHSKAHLSLGPAIRRRLKWLR